MSIHTFLFTYSVSPVDQKHKNIADVIRDRIARLDGEYGWKKLSDVETAFKGELNLVYESKQSKRKEAEKDITKILETVFDSDYPSYSVFISVALLVDGLHDVIEFRF
jgi:hypothetical protein